MSKAKKLPPFDANARCPKCGHDKVNAVWQEAEHVSCPWTCDEKEPERIERWCDRCRYRWAEACISQPPPPRDRGTVEEAGG